MWRLLRRQTPRAAARNDIVQEKCGMNNFVDGLKSIHGVDCVDINSRFS
jgi:hypothetical protein